MKVNNDHLVAEEFMAAQLGETVVPRHSGVFLHAGARGAKAGKELENRVENMFLRNGITYEDQPKYMDPFTRLPRKCDFLIRDDDGNKVFVEVKQFSDLGSHLQKIPEHLQTAAAGGYGNHFCILYDKHPTKNVHQARKWRGLMKRWEPLLQAAAQNGVRVDILHIDEFMQVIFPNGLTHTLNV